MKYFTLVCGLVFLSISIFAQYPGKLDPTFRTGFGLSSSARALCIQSDGKILVGGLFTSYDSVPCGRLARLNTDGTLDTSFIKGAGINNYVSEIIQQPDGRILVAGTFASYNGTAIKNVARIHANGNLDTTFNPGTSSTAELYALALQPDGKILVGGNFTGFNGEFKGNLVRLNTNGSVDTSFNTSIGASYYVQDIIIQPDSKILIAGAFGTYNGVARNCIARINANGSLDTTFNPGSAADYYVTSMALQPDGKIVIGGLFGTYNGTPRNYIARINSNGSLDLTFNPGSGANTMVHEVMLQADGKVLLAGGFATVNGKPRKRIARLNSDGSVDDLFNPGVSSNGDIYRTAPLPDGKIIFAGIFSTYGGVLCNRIGRLQGNKGIEGFVYNDINQDCVRANTGEAGLKGRLVTIQPGNVLAQTDTLGYWRIDSLPAGNYTITADTLGPWHLTCPYSQSFTVVNPDSATAAPSFGFASTNLCASGYVSITAPALRRCFSNQYVYVQACNGYAGTQSLDSAYVVVELSHLFTVTGSSLPYTALGQNKYKVNVGSIAPGDCVSFNLATTLGCLAFPGRTICLRAGLYPIPVCAKDTTPKYCAETISTCTTAWDSSQLVSGSYCPGDSVCLYVKNTGSNMNCLAPVNIYRNQELVKNYKVQLAAGDSALYKYAANGDTWRISTTQHPNHPFHSCPNSAIEACGDSVNPVLGVVNTLPVNEQYNWQATYCGVVTGSFDPNDKTGYPTGITSNHYIAPNQTLNYVVRFQNTGTDTAFTVVVRDTLSPNLDIYTLKPGVSSHKYTFRIYGQRIAEWRFDNILLPDSNHNEAESHGFLTFDINQQPDLPNGTVINNWVGIYFDFNDPVITNTASHTINRASFVIIETAVPETALDGLALQLIPNPSSNTATIILSDELVGAGLQVFDITGKLVINTKALFNANALNISDLGKGIYVVVAQKDKITRRAKLVVE